VATTFMVEYVLMYTRDMLPIWILLMRVYPRRLSGFWRKLCLLLMRTLMREGEVELRTVMEVEEYMTVS